MLLLLSLAMPCSVAFGVAPTASITPSVRRAVPATIRWTKSGAAAFFSSSVSICLYLLIVPKASTGKLTIRKS